MAAPRACALLACSVLAHAAESAVYHEPPPRDVVLAGADTTFQGASSLDFTVMLTVAPTANVTIAVSSDDSLVTPNETSLTFTPSNWNQPQALAATASESGYDDGNARTSVVLFGAATSNDTAYCSTPMSDLTLTHTFPEDKDVFVVSEHASRDVRESQTTELYVRLASQPTANVSMDVASLNPTRLTVTPASLTFASSSWAMDQTVTVSAPQEDQVNSGPIEIPVVFRATTSSDGNFSGKTAGARVFTVVDPVFGFVSRSQAAPSRFVGVEAGAAVNQTTEVVLLTQPTGSVMVTISLSTAAVTASAATLNFTTANWNTTQTVTFAATSARDGIYVGGNATATASYSVSSTDGRFSAVTLSPETYVFTEGDVPALSSNISGEVREGASGVFSVGLNVAASDEVVVSLSASANLLVLPDPAMVVIPAGQLSADFTVSYTDDDVYVADNNVTVTLTATSDDAAFAGLSATGIIQLSNVQEVVFGNLPLDLYEYNADRPVLGTAELQVKLREAIASKTIVHVNPKGHTGTVSGALTFEANNWDTFQTVTLTAEDNAYYGAANTSQEYNVTIGVSFDASFTGYVGEFSVNLVENDGCDAIEDFSYGTGNGMGSADAALEVDEDAVTTFAVNVSLKNATAADLVLKTYDNQNVTYPAASTVPNDTLTISVPASGTVNNQDGTGRYWTYAKLVIDDARSGAGYAANHHPSFVCWQKLLYVKDLDNDGNMTVDPLEANLTQIAEATKKTYNVSLTKDLASANGVNDIAVVEFGFSGSLTQITFTAGNATGGQQVEVDYNIDNVYGDGSDAQRNLTFQIADNKQYNTSTTIDQLSVVVVTDDDAPVSVQWPAAEVDEGAEAVVVVTLDEAPDGDTTIALNTSTDGVHTNITPAQLVFSAMNFATAQTFTVSALDDGKSDNFTSVLMFDPVSGAGAGAKFLNRYVQTDPAGFQLTKVNTDALALVVSDPVLTVTEDNTAQNGSVQVKLSHEPTAPVTLTFTADTAQVTLAAASVTWSVADYNVSKEVAFFPIADLVDDGNASVTLAAKVTGDAAFASLGNVDLGVIQVTDAANDVTDLNLAAAGTTVDECGATQTVNVSLNTKPVADVTVRASTTSDDIALDSSNAVKKMFTFSPATYSQVQVLTITGLDDDMMDGSQAALVTWSITTTDATYTAYDTNADTLNITAIDDGDVAGVAVSPATIVFDERVTAESVVVRLHSKPTADVVVSLVGVDATEAVLNVSALTFSSSTWDAAQTIEVSSRTDFAIDGDVTFSVDVSVASGDAVYNGLAIANAVNITTRDAVTSYLMQLEPKTFTAGQELRLELQTALIDPVNGGRIYTKFFNTSDATGLSVKTFAYNSAHGTNCEAYNANDQAFSTTDRFGVASAEEGDLTGKVYMTVVAPPSEFVICFNHAMPETQHYIHSAHNGKWEIFHATGMNATLQSADAGLYYHMPDASVGQYAIVEVLAKNGVRNFTHPRSACAGSVGSCRDADNIKVVPAGAECTYEYPIAQAYYGSAEVEASGNWRSTADAGLLEGASVGGVGAFGTQRANPLVDVWTQTGSYFEVRTVGNDSVPTYPPAYAYLRLPPSAGAYDVCYSNHDEREQLATGSYVVPAVPVWRKLRRCTTTANCDGEAHALSFTVAVEPVGWTMADLTPGTYGDILFDDSGAGQLDNSPATNYPLANASAVSVATAADVAEAKDYWTPLGGDAFKVLPATLFGEAAGTKRAGVATAADVGSLAAVGCWSNAYDAPTTYSGTPLGGFDGSAEHPLASLDLTGDPTAPLYGTLDAPWRLANLGFPANVTVDAATEDSGLQSQTFGVVHLPPNGTDWHVCYRRTCNAAGATCAKHSGWRVLPYHYSQRGRVPQYWFHLEEMYTPGTTDIDVLRPGRYDVRDQLDAPLRLSWYTDARAVYAHASVPIAVEVDASVNTTADPRRLSAQASTYHRPSTTTDRIGDTVGTALRLVPASSACAYRTFYHDIASMDAEAVNDGGRVECDSSLALTDATACVGRQYDVASTDSVVFYATLPKAGANYSVCVRERYGNWRKIDVRAYVTPDTPAPTSVNASNATTAPTPAAVFPSTSALYNRSDAGTFPSHNSVEPITRQVLLDVFSEDRGGYEALFVVSDADQKLSSADRSTAEGSGGDVLRVVAAHDDCIITPSFWEPRLADLRPGLISPQNGTGTLATSGVVQATVGTLNPDLTQRPEYSNRTDILAGWLRNLPPHYDDIVPAIAQFSSRGHAASGIVLPAASHNNANGMFKVCYKLAGELSWLQFRYIADTQHAAGDMSVEPAPAAEKLVSGEKKMFTLKFDQAEYFGADAPNASAATFHAKLVQFDSTSAATVYADSVVNKACQMSPPGSTEGTDGASSTTAFAFTSNTSLTFSLTAPHTPGRYSLCVQLRSGMRSADSWWRPVAACTATDRTCEYSYDVVDNGVRWYVMPGAQPINQGLSTVDLISTGIFNTDAGADAAKVVSAAHDCDAVSPDVDVTRGGIPVADLGPADGASDVARFKVSLPAVGGDARAQYKVCVYTRFAVDGTATDARWVEVRQAAGVAGQLNITDARGDPAFSSAEGLLSHWSVATGVQPLNSLLSAAVGNVALAGASSRYVTNPNMASGEPVPADGFEFVTYSNVPSDMRAGTDTFKLVLAKRPVTPQPDSQLDIGTWGNVSAWETLNTDCFDPAVDSAASTAACTVGDAGCPQLRTIDASTTTTSLPALLHFPLAAGAYHVCFRRSTSAPQPWQQLTGTGGDALLYTHPAFMEVVVSGDKRNATVTDSRVWRADSGEAAGAGSWCAEGSVRGEGVDCTRQRFAADLLTVAVGQQVCNVPSTAPAGSSQGAPEWFKMRRVFNSSTAVTASWSSDADKFVMPPLAAQNVTSSFFKVCVYKAGAVQNWQNASSAIVARNGVVYQLANAGKIQNGGGSGYWADSASVAKLVVTTTIGFNPSERFVEFTEGVEAALGGVNDSQITDSQTNLVSRVPVIDSRDTVEFLVQAVSAAGDVVPYGTVLVEAKRCPIASDWSGLGCADPLANDADGFTLRNVGGQCGSVDSAKYGWSRDALKQHTVNGFVKFTLQYGNGCGGNAFGCGVVFEGTALDVPLGAAVVSSAPQYVNVRSVVPDGVAINGRVVATGVAGTPGSTAGCTSSVESTAVQCYVHECVSGVRCPLSVQAVSGGVHETAPTGSVMVGFTGSDYNTTASLEMPAAVSKRFVTFSGQGPPMAWGTNGEREVSIIPILRGGFVQEVVYLNATFGTHWARFVVRVSRPQPVGASVVSIAPLDVKLGMPAGLMRSPVPLPTVASGRVGSGEYLEALVPYEVRVSLTDAAGAVLPESFAAMSGWTVSAEVAEAPSTVLILKPADDPMQNLVTVSELFKSFAQTIADSNLDFRFAFRVYATDNTCSRFATAGGCTISFDFTRSGYADVRAPVVAAVRIPASTLAVEVSAAAATVREGVTVGVRPGTYVVGPTHTAVFVEDEFHYADVFALVDGPGMNDGTMTRDGFMVLPAAGATGCVHESAAKECLVATYGASRQMFAAGNGWGAKWTLYGDRPCHQCMFTFHTTWGAGPESGSPGWASGTAEVTFLGEKLQPVCSSVDAVLVQSGAGWAAMFDLSVTAGVEGVDGANAVYPRSWVYANKTTDVTFSRVSGTGNAAQLTLSDGNSLQVLAMQMQRGVAVFNDLTVTAPNAEEGTQWSVAIKFMMMMPEYASTEPGSSTVTSQKEATCTSTVTLTQPAAAPAVPMIHLVGVSSAAPMCEDTATGAAVCNEYMATEAELTAGVEFKVSFAYSDGTDLQRNVTISPKAAGSSPLYPSGPTFTAHTDPQVVNSTAVRLESRYNSLGAGAATRGEYQYTHGTATVVAERAAAGSATSLTLKYTTQTAEPWPVREAVFALCATKGGDDDAPDATVCTDIHLWVTPDTEAARALALWEEPTAANFTTGGSATCGGQSLTFAAVAYYTSQAVTSKTRFFVYDAQVEFTFAAVGQVQNFVTHGSGNAQVAKSVLVKNTPSNGTTDMLLGRVTLWGLDAVNAPVQVTAMAVATDGAAISGLQTGTTYYWTKPASSITGFKINSAVTADTECPTRRQLMTSTSNYRTYDGGVPGMGWDYSATPVSVGVPFPVQAIVTSDVTGSNADGRALGFTDGTLVKVTKQSWRACNNGGELTVYSLKGSAAEGPTLLPGSVGSFVASADMAVPTSMGVASAWPVFSAPCRECTLQVELCYTGATAAECRSSYGLGSSDPSDASPAYGDRVRTTKPFTVQPFRADLLQVFSQTAPNASHHVGDLFEVGFEVVQVFGGRWAMTQPPAPEQWRAQVRVRTAWTAAGRMSTYANGGFLTEGSARAALGASAVTCTITDGDFAAGAPSTRGTLLQLSDAGVGSFFFTRPCTTCEVHVDYVLTPPANSWDWAPVTGTFALREYGNPTAPSLSAPAVFDVATCGKKWIFAHAPSVAVRKRKSFALTLLRVDSFHIAAADTQSGLTADFRPTAASGNGAGGRAVVTSPLASSGRVRTHKGTAMVRLHYTRACYDCGVTLGGLAHRMTVLADATRIMAVPRDADYVKHEQNKAKWTFDVYAADMMGDRAYTIAGPTSTAHQNRYATYHAGGPGRKAATLGVSGTVAEPRARLANGTAVTAGVPDVSVVSGTAVYNGLPMPQLTVGEAGPLGAAVVQLAQPAAGCELAFAMSAASGLPTVAAGLMTPPRVSYVPKPTLAALEDMSQRKCVVGTPCEFSVHAVSADGNSWYAPSAGYGNLRPTAPGPIDSTFAVSAACGTCGAPEVTGVVGSLADGHWTYSLLVPSVTEACVCNVTVVPDTAALPAASPLMFTTAFEFVALDTWRFAVGVRGTDTFAPAADGSAFAVLERMVDVAVEAYDATGTYVDIGGIAWPEGAPTVAIGPGDVFPLGCFVCEGGVPDPEEDTKSTCPVTLSRGGGRVVVRGHFTALGACQVKGSALHLPLGEMADTVVTTDLSVTVEAPAAFALLHDPLSPVDRSYFTALLGRTLEGDKAAIAGVGSSVTLQVVDSDGAVLRGENSMAFAVTGSTSAGRAWKTATGTARNGVVTIPLVSDATTRTLCGNVNATSGCVHDPWVFTISASAVLANGTTVSYGSISNVGPLSFVRRADRLSAMVKRNGAVEDLAEAAERAPMAWQYGRPMPPVHVTARDGSGVVASSAEDQGSRATVLFQAASPPCTAVDMTDGGRFPLTTCIAGGTCAVQTIATLPQCSLVRSSGWSVSAERFTLADGGAVLNATYGVGTSSTPGATQFLLTTEDFGIESDPQPMQSVFPFRVNFQSIAGVRVSHPNFLCRGLRDDGVVGTVICSLPSTYFVQPMAIENYDVALVDASGEPVAADSDSVVRVEAECLSADSDSVVLVNGRYSLDTPEFVVSGGVVRVANVSFSNLCPRMSVKFKCVGPLCNGVALALELAVRYFDPERTVPPSTTEIALSCLSLGTTQGLSLAAFENADDDYESGLDTLLGTLDQRITAAGARTILDYLCFVAAGQCIGLEDKLDTAKCIDFTVTPAPPTPAPEVNVTLPNATAARLFDSLQDAGGEAVADGRVVFDAPIDLDDSLFTTIKTAIVTDLGSDMSVLKMQSAIFANADAGRTTVDQSSGTTLPPPPPSVTPASGTPVDVNSTAPEEGGDAPEEPSTPPLPRTTDSPSIATTGVPLTLPPPTTPAGTVGPGNATLLLALLLAALTL